jgi:predicted nucleotidyltransferase
MRIDHSLFPTIRRVKWLMRNNSTRPIYYDVLEAYVIGSYAKGTATRESDLDIALVIPPQGIPALKLSERYHACFEFNEYKPKFSMGEWDVIVDFQFFYPGSKELSSYKKILLKAK